MCVMHCVQQILTRKHTVDKLVDKRAILVGFLAIFHRQNGVLAQLVERLNGIEEVRGSNPLGSMSPLGKEHRLPARLPSPLRSGQPISFGRRKSFDKWQ